MNLDDVLAPLDLRTYLEQNWDGVSRYIPGTLGKFRGLYSIPELFRTLHRASESALYITATCSREEGAPHAPRERIGASDVPDRLRQGATVCVSQVDIADEKLKDFATRVKSSIGYVGETHVNAYLSPPGSGFDAHFDARSIVNLQISGHKRWRYVSTPSVRWPAGNALLVNGSIEYCDESPSDWEAPPRLCAPLWQEIVLKPGDVLCMPAGVLHAAKAETLSLALNLHFNAVNVGQVLGEALNSRLVHLAHWRHVPPILSNLYLHSGVGETAATHLRTVLQNAICVLQEWHDNVAELQELLIASSASRSGRKDPAPQPVAPQTCQARLAPEVSVLGGLDGGVMTLIVGESRITCEAPHADMIRLCIKRRSVPWAELMQLAPKDTAEKALFDLLQSQVVQLNPARYQP